MGLSKQKKKLRINLLITSVGGTWFEGERGFAAAPLDKRQYLTIAFFSQIIIRKTSKKLMERLIHSSTFPFMHRRELLAVFGETYIRMDSLSYGVVYAVPGKVVNEMIYAALLMLIAFSSLRRPVDSEVSATDATPYILGFVRCNGPSKSCQMPLSFGRRSW